MRCLADFSPCKVAVVDGTIISPLPHFNHQFRHERCERTKHFLLLPKYVPKAASSDDTIEHAFVANCNCVREIKGVVVCSFCCWFGQQSADVMQQTIAIYIQQMPT